MQLIEIDPRNQTDWRRFHRVPHYIYRNDPHWIAPLEGDIEGIFSDKNKAFRNGACRLWVLENDAGRPLGRIAAFVDKARNMEQPFPTGGIGFFESVNDKAVADKLLGLAEDWLRGEGVHAIDGPINFGERDKFWGLLVRGWYRPIYQENYHAPYYRAFFEDRGFLENEQCLTLRGVIREYAVDRLRMLAGRVRDRYGYHCRQVSRNNFRQGAVWFVEVYNQAFRHWSYFKPLTVEEVYPIFKQMRPIFDPNLTAIAFDGERPIGIAALIPDLNDYLDGFDGRLSWWKLPRLLWRLKFQKRLGVKGIAFGIDQDYQRKGVFPLLIEYMYSVNDEYNPRTYEYVDLATIRGYNDIMVETCRQIGNEPHRVHMAYRKPLVEGLDWTPFKQLDVAHVSLGEVPDIGMYPVS